MGGYFSRQTVIPEEVSTNWLLITDEPSMADVICQGQNANVDVLYIKEFTLNDTWDRMIGYSHFIWDVDNDQVMPFFFARSSYHINQKENHYCFWPQTKENNMYRTIADVNYFNNTTDIVKMINKQVCE